MSSIKDAYDQFKITNYLGLYDQLSLQINEDEYDETNRSIFVNTENKCFLIIFCIVYL